MKKTHIVARRATCAAAIALLAACATNPVTGRRELALVSESQEIEMGKQYSAEVIQSIGLVNDQTLQNYVRNLGLAIAAKSERPNIPWQYHLLDDASVNAFALPGGPVFVTRGLITHMMNEAELVSVLGHETGHITARHTVQQMSTQTALQVLLIGGSIASSTIAKFGDLASAGLGVMFLKFSRDDETQADQLGFKYTLNGGYDVREMVGVFEMLQRQAQLSGAGRLPEWQSTHPDPGNRIKATQDRIAAVTEDLSTKRVGTSEFLTKIDGMIYGENPRLGFFEGTVFMHPDLKFRFEFPAGWKTQNQAAAVLGISAAQDALTQIAFAKGSATEASQAFFSQQGVTAGSVSRGSIHGFPAVQGDFSAATQEGTLRGIASFVEYGGATYAILSYTPTEKYNSYASAFQRAHASFDRLTDARALAVQPNRVKIERASRAMTLAQFNQSLPSQISLDELAVINGMASNTMLSAGQMVKRVVR